MDDANSIRVVRDIGSLDGELDKLLVAVALTENLRMRIFESKNKLDEICAEGPFKLKGSGICCCLKLPMPCAWCEFSVAVGRAASWSLGELAKEIRTHPGDRVHAESERPPGTRILSPLEVEVENAVAEARALADRSGELVLTVALLEDGTLRVFRSDRARSVLENELPRALFFDCCDAVGNWVPCGLGNIPRGFIRIAASWFSERAQRLWDL